VDFRLIYSLFVNLIHFCESLHLFVNLNLFYLEYATIVTTYRKRNYKHFKMWRNDIVMEIWCWRGAKLARTGK